MPIEKEMVVGTMFLNSKRPWYLWTAAAVLTHFSVILVLNLCRHWGYLTSINDLGVSDQIVWGLLNGGSFLNTSQLDLPINWLGFHFQPVYVCFVPLYWLLPSVIWFALAHAFSLSLTGWILFRLASSVLGSEQIGFMWAVAFLVHPAILNAGAFEFTPITLAVPFAAAAMTAVERKNIWLLVVSVCMILTCKEHLGAMAVGFGVLWGLRNKTWKPAAALIILGVVHTVVVLGIFMPELSVTRTHIMFSQDFGQLSRYGWLGNTLGNVFRTIIGHPFDVMHTLILKMAAGKYIALLLMFFLGFPLFSLEFLLPGIGDFAANLLSSNPLPRSILSFHNVTLITLMAVASVYGVRRICRHPKWAGRYTASKLTAMVLAVNLLAGYLLAPLPLPGARNLFAPVRPFRLPDPAVAEVRAVIGDSASLSVQANVGAHLSQRKEIYRFPSKMGLVDAVVLRLESPTRNVQPDPAVPATERKYISNLLDGCLQMDRTDYISAIENLLQEDDWGILLWKDPWLVLGRGAEGKQWLAPVREKLDVLKNAWGINQRKSTKNGHLLRGE